MSIFHRNDHGEKDVFIIVLLIAAAVLVLGKERSDQGRLDGEAKGAAAYQSGTTDGQQAAETAAGSETVPAAAAEEEIPFVNIMEADSTELTVTWEGLTQADQSVISGIEAEVQEAYDAFAASGYTAGFLLYDLNSGGGISCRADAEYYSASTIKGPYVAWLVETYPQTVDTLYNTMENTISWSSNEDYELLIASFGYSEFNDWAAGMGCQNIVITGEWYPTVNAREFAKIWCHMYDSIVSGGSLGSIIDLYNGTLSSAIYETLGGEYTVYSKAGWIGEGLGSYYNVQNDAGIVMKEDHPYVLVILSDAYGRLDLLDNLVAVLDRAHTTLAE